MSARILKPGTRLKSAVSTAQIMVLKAPPGEIDLRCGGAPMLDMAAADGAGEVVVGHEGEVLTGKRYTDETESLELLCTKGGAGVLSANGVTLPVKQAKPLPSSD